MDLFLSNSVIPEFATSVEFLAEIHLKMKENAVLIAISYDTNVKNFKQIFGRNVIYIYSHRKIYVVFAKKSGAFSLKDLQNGKQQFFKYFTTVNVPVIKNLTEIFSGFIPLITANHSA